MDIGSEQAQLDLYDNWGWGGGTQITLTPGGITLPLNPDYSQSKPPNKHEKL